MKLSCKDVNPESSCNYEARGNTATEVANSMLAHVKKAHADDVKGMSDTELLASFEAKVHE